MTHPQDPPTAADMTAKSIEIAADVADKARATKDPQGFIESFFAGQESDWAHATMTRAKMALLS